MLGYTECVDQFNVQRSSIDVHRWEQYNVDDYIVQNYHARATAQFIPCCVQSAYRTLYWNIGPSCFPMENMSQNESKKLTCLESG